MRITNLEIDGFGIWSRMQLNEFPRDLVVFYGPNEAGKTTLMQFVRTVMFGFSPERTKNFVTGPFRKGPGRIGGQLRLSTHEGQFHVSRHASDLDPTNRTGDLRVTTVDGARAGSYRLEQLLDGIDEAVYNNVFAVGIDEIQELNTLSATQASQYLYSLSTGADRVSLVDVMRQLRTARAQLVGNEEKPGQLSLVLAERDRQLAKIDQLADRTQQWGELRSQIRALDLDVESLEARRDQLRLRMRTAELAIRVRPKWQDLQQVSQEIDSLGVIRNIPDNILARLGSANDRIVQRQQELETLRAKRQELSQRAEQTPVREALVRQAARVEVLLDQRKWLASLDETVRRLDTQIEETEFEIQSEQERLGIQAFVSQPQPLNADTVASLRDPARHWKRAKQRLAMAKRETGKLKAEADRLQKEIAGRLGTEIKDGEDAPKDDVGKALKKVDTLASGYRRRIDLTQQLVELQDQLSDLDSRHTRLLSSQFLPKPVLTALGLLFAIGAALVMASVFQAVDESRRGWLMLLGGAMCGTAAMLKWTLDSSSRGDLRGIETRRENVRGDIQSMVGEIEALGGTVDDQGENSQRDLQEAEQRLGRVEQLVPLDRKRQEILSRAKQAEQRAIAAANELKSSRAGWVSAVQHLGLPADLTPPKLKLLMGRSGAVNGLRAKVADLKNQRELAQRELSSTQTRILALYREAAINPPSDNVVQQLDQLVQTTQSQKDLVAKRDALRREARQLQRDEDRIEQGIIQLQRKSTSLIAAAGVTNEDELRRVVDRRDLFARLKERSETLQRELTMMYGDDIDGKEVESELRRNDVEQLSQRLKQLQRDVSQSEQQLKDRLQSRGELAQKIKTLEEDHSLEEAHLLLGIAENKLAAGLDRWKAMTAITYMLKSVYKRYEKDRQPHTLRQASDFLRAMTEGRYTRVWTPLAEDILLVDGKQGESLPLDMLSRGTREQIFLALRLALVADYARRGIKIPMVLDDVLVNYDMIRARAAAKVLVEFAREGHQMLVFTCHEHVMNIFQDLGAEVRNLPRHADEVQPALLAQKSPKPLQVTADAKKERRRRLAAASTAESITDSSAAVATLPPPPKSERTTSPASRAMYNEQLADDHAAPTNHDEDDSAETAGTAEQLEHEFESDEVDGVDTELTEGIEEEVDYGEVECDEETDEEEVEEESEEEYEEEGSEEEEEEVEYEYIEVDEDEAAELVESDDEYEYEYVEVDDEDEGDDDDQRSNEAA